MTLINLTPKEIVENFWLAMQSNDFAKASEWLSEDYELTWPMSGERIIGRDNFVAVNSYYPANGEWVFTVHSLLVEGGQSCFRRGGYGWCGGGSSHHLFNRQKQPNHTTTRILARPL